MGTNFYGYGGKHIGKRSAAGLYCWDCGTTLCVSGNNGVHKDESYWYEACPKCGKKPIEENLASGAAGRELGFNKTPFSRGSGVSSCSSFTWAIDPEKFKGIKDEYGRKYTREEFDKMLEECPIQYFDMIGEEFS